MNRSFRIAIVALLGFTLTAPQLAWANSGRGGLFNRSGVSSTNISPTNLNRSAGNQRAVPRRSANTPQPNTKSLPGSQAVNRRSASQAQPRRSTNFQLPANRAVLTPGTANAASPSSRASAANARNAGRVNTAPAPALSNSNVRRTPGGLQTNSAPNAVRRNPALQSGNAAQSQAGRTITNPSGAVQSPGGRVVQPTVSPGNISQPSAGRTTAPSRTSPTASTTTSSPPSRTPAVIGNQVGTEVGKGRVTGQRPAANQPSGSVLSPNRSSLPSNMTELPTRSAAQPSGNSRPNMGGVKKANDTFNDARQAGNDAATGNGRPRGQEEKSKREQGAQTPPNPGQQFSDDFGFPPHLGLDQPLGPGQEHVQDAMDRFGDVVRDRIDQAQDDDNAKDNARPGRGEKDGKDGHQDGPTARPRPRDKDDDQGAGQHDGVVGDRQDDAKQHHDDKVQDQNDHLQDYADDYHDQPYEDEVVDKDYYEPFPPSAGFPLPFPLPVPQPALGAVPTVGFPVQETVITVPKVVYLEAPPQAEATEPVDEANPSALDDQLPVVALGNTVQLAGDEPGEEQGSVILEVGKLMLPVAVESWEAPLVRINMPIFGLVEATTATLHVLRADNEIDSSIPIELVPSQQQIEDSQ